MKNYIINGRVAREEIASDICDGVISREDIKFLVENQDIKSAFIGTSYNKKKYKQEWNKNYLEALPNVAVAEAFNEDYLYYLSDVTEYVKANERKKNVTKWVWLVVAIVVAIGIVTCFAIMS